MTLGRNFRPVLWGPDLCFQLILKFLKMYIIEARGFSFDTNGQIARKKIHGTLFLYITTTLIYYMQKRGKDFTSSTIMEWYTELTEMA